MTVTLDSPLRDVVGAKTAKALLDHLELATVGDLLYHFPRRYDQRGEYTDIRTLTVGEQATVLARVISSRTRPMRQRSGQLLEVVVGDDSGGTLTLTFFGRQAWRAGHLQPGRWGLFAGKVGKFNATRQLNQPDYVLLDEVEGGVDGGEVLAYAGAIIPVYPAAAAVPTWIVANCVRVALDMLEPPPDPMPSTLRAARQLADLPTALRLIHRPDSFEALGMARRRLKWDEAFAVQVTLVQRKLRAQDWPAKPRPRRAGGLLDEFDASLPYQLTNGQRAVGEQLASELETPHPMHRLLQGEVGSGKTLCALRAMLQVVDAGGQAALLAPTEVLAGQHHRSLLDLLGPLARAGELDSAPEATRVALVTGALGAAARRKTLAELADGSAGLVVGTHALLYEGVDFADLGLVVIDEQHRFGVEQRDALRAKAAQPPHTLVMTATPIPRTVAMTVYGDLEISTLTELPAGRSPIATHVVPAAERPAYLERAWQRVREEVAKGHQAYVVCPRIGEAGAGEAGADEDSPDGGDGEEKRAPLAVLEIAPLLEAGDLAGLRLGVLHGRLGTDEKDAVMRTFAAGGIDVLVATTVVEVGVNVPNATVMIVLDADRFGVSQLHQLRGRIGRGSAPGLCLLVTDAPAEAPARARLDAVAATLDGFELAELDLEQRREGDVLGANQSGHRSTLRLLSLRSDRELIGEARLAAIGLLEPDPELSGYPLLRDYVAGFVDDERAEFLEKG